MLSLHPRLLVSDTFLAGLERVELHNNKILFIKQNGDCSEMFSNSSEDAQEMMKHLTDNILNKPFSSTTMCEKPVFGQKSAFTGNSSFCSLSLGKDKQTIFSVPVPTSKSASISSSP